MELLVHLTDNKTEEKILKYGLLKNGGVIYFHRLRPGRKGHTLIYLKKYADVSGLILITVDPADLDPHKLQLSRYEAKYYEDIPSELVKVIR